jgi:hypothetical protein
MASIEEVVQTTINVGEPITITVNIEHCSLSVPQVRVLSALIFALDYCEEFFGLDRDYYGKSRILIYDQAEDDITSIDPKWMGNTIRIHDAQGKENMVYDVSSETEGYVIIPNKEWRGHNENHITITCDAQGYLHSMDGNPAIFHEAFEKTQSLKNQIWFEHGLCYRDAAPLLPAMIIESLGQHYHFNAQGELHRDLSEGPAVYPIHNTPKSLLDNSFPRYYLNGELVDEHGNPSGFSTSLIVHLHKKEYFTMPAIGSSAL